MSLKLGSKNIQAIYMPSANSSAIIPSGIFDIPSRSGTYDVKSYAFARASFTDDFIKRIDGTLTEYSNSTISRVGILGLAGTNITSVNLPNVSYIDQSAFRDCRSLISVTLPALTSMNTYAFAFCSSLVSFSFPLCSYIGSYTFQNCNSLESQLQLPSNITRIYPGAFSSCTNLITVECLGATTVEGFTYCSNLLDLSLPVATTISGLSNNPKLEYVYAPSCVSIGN